MVSGTFLPDGGTDVSSVHPKRRGVWDADQIHFRSRLVAGMNAHLADVMRGSPRTISVRGGNFLGYFFFFRSPKHAPISCHPTPGAQTTLASSIGAKSLGRESRRDMSDKDGEHFCRRYVVARPGPSGAMAERRKGAKPKQETHRSVYTRLLRAQLPMSCVPEGFPFTMVEANRTNVTGSQKNCEY